MYQAPDIPLTFSRATFGNGMRGIRDTLRVMRAMVDEGKCHPLIVNAARSTIFLSPQKSALHEIESLFALVRDSIRYTQDILDVETLMAPDKTLLTRQGDCDDQVTLLCSLFEAVGYPTQFVIAGYSQPGVYEHVYCRVWCAQNSDPSGFWIDCDPTEDQALGWAPPDPVALAVETI